VPGFLYLTFIATKTFIKSPAFAACEFTAAGSPVGMLNSKDDIAMASEFCTNN
jgi:hypothetical protein